MDAEACEELLDALKACFQIDLELELPENMRFQYFFEVKGGFDSLEALQHASVKSIRDTACDLIKEYLPFEEHDGASA